MPKCHLTCSNNQLSVGKARRDRMVMRVVRARTSDDIRLGCTMACLSACVPSTNSTIPRLLVIDSTV